MVHYIKYIFIIYRYYNLLLTLCLINIFIFNLKGAKTIKILNVLDALDRHSFERIDQNNSLDTLYNKIFLPPNFKDNSNPLLAVGNMSMSTENETLKDNRSEYVNIVFILYIILIFLILIYSLEC